MTEEDLKKLVEHLHGPHEWGYRDPVEGGFIEDHTPFHAADAIEALRVKLKLLEGVNDKLLIENGLLRSHAQADADTREFVLQLNDPKVVHQHMLRGAIATPSVHQIIHIYGAEALLAELGK
jgi:hypothetical protein